VIPWNLGRFTTVVREHHGLDEDKREAAHLQDALQVIPPVLWAMTHVAENRPKEAMVVLKDVFDIAAATLSKVSRARLSRVTALAGARGIAPPDDKAEDIPLEDLPDMQSMRKNLQEHHLWEKSGFHSESAQRKRERKSKRLFGKPRGSRGTGGHGARRHSPARDDRRSDHDGERNAKRRRHDKPAPPKGK
jgi:hypothetical protein